MKWTESGILQFYCTIQILLKISKIIQANLKADFANMIQKLKESSQYCPCSPPAWVLNEEIQ